MAGLKEGSRFLNISKSLKSNPDPTQQLVSINSQLIMTACQYPEGIISIGLFESNLILLNFLLLSSKKYKSRRAT